MSMDAEGLLNSRALTPGASTPAEGNGPDELKSARKMILFFNHSFNGWVLSAVTGVNERA
jgi:hypothetical protein